MTPIRLRTYHGLDIETADGARFAQAAGPAEAALIIRAVNAVAEPVAPAFPIINLNGTSAEELQDQQRRLYSALGDLEKALNNAIPHGRDYQTAGAGSYSQARKEHDVRCAAIQQMLRDVEQVWSAINDQVKARRA